MSNIKALTVPRWGMAMEEGTLVAWLVSEGDAISAGTEVAELESSKIVNVLEAHDAGTLRRRTAKEGDTLPVGALLGVVAAAEVPDADIDAFINEFRRDDAPPVEELPDPATSPERAAVQPDAPAAAAGSALRIPGSLKTGKEDSSVAASPHARRFASRHGIDLNMITASGRHDRVLVLDIERAIRDAGGDVPARPRHRPSRGAVRPSSCGNGEVHATPLARRLAAQHGVNLADCRVSGSRGRVCGADVEAFLALHDRRPAAAKTPPRTSGAAPSGIPLAGMRRTIAERLQAAKREIPHYRLGTEAAVDELMKLRSALPNSVTMNDLLVRACALALMEVPACNIQFRDGSVLRFASADIAVAVALDDGLITPIVRAAETKGVEQISAEIADLVERARAGALRQEEYEGGTFTISNLGMYGISRFDAIINPPQASILAVGRAEQRPVVRDGNVSVATLLTLTLSCDHRVIDGATGAQFLAALKGTIEAPEKLLGGQS